MEPPRNQGESHSSRPPNKVHDLLVALLGSAQHSIVVNMFGYDDDELNQIIQSKLEDATSTSR